MRVLFAAALLGAAYAQTKSSNWFRSYHDVYAEAQSNNGPLKNRSSDEGRLSKNAQSVKSDLNKHGANRADRAKEEMVRLEEEQIAKFGDGEANVNEFVAGTNYQDVLDDVEANYGWDVTRYDDVVTDDDYNLELWRLVDQTTPATDGHPVLLVHSGGQCGVAWLNNFENSIAYQLADEGYDVWILNDRMSAVMSTVHTTLTTADASFWSDMSFGEVGKYDIPAAIDYITSTANGDGSARSAPNTNFSDSVTVVAHGTGATALLSTMPEERKSFYDPKLDSVVLLSPVSQLTDTEDELEWGQWVYQIREWLEDNAWYINQDNELIADDGTTVIDLTEQMWQDYAADSEEAFSQEATMYFIDAWLEAFQDPGYQAKDTHPVPYEFNAWTTFKNILHLSQTTREGSFQEWNFMNALINTVVYGQEDPTDFDITEIDTTNIKVVYADWDRLVREDDIDFLQDNLSTASFHEIDGGFATPLQGQDMSYFASEVLPFILANLPVDESA